MSCTISHRVSVLPRAQRESQCVERQTPSAISKRQTKSAPKPHLLRHNIYSANQHGFSNWSLKLALSQLTVTQLRVFSHGDTKTQMSQTLDACINKNRIFPLYALGTDTHIGSPGNRHISISSTATQNATINIQRNFALPTGKPYHDISLGTLVTHTASPTSSIKKDKGTPCSPSQRQQTALHSCCTSCYHHSIGQDTPSTILSREPFL